MYDILMILQHTGNSQFWIYVYDKEKKDKDIYELLSQVYTIEYNYCFIL